jgi:MIP family channel proteins
MSCLTHPTFLRACFAEYLATALLVGFGCGAIVVDNTMGHVIGHAGVAIAFGLAVMALIYAFGAESGAHANPAVTIGFWLAKRFPGKQVPCYMAAQLLGGLTAALLLWLLLPAHPTLGATIPSGTWWQSFVLEIILTFVLMLVILQVATGAKEIGVVAAIAIGGTVALEALVAGPICGASMNPARSLSPALIAGVFEHQWIYVVAPILGSAIAVFTWRILRPIHGS